MISTYTYTPTRIYTCMYIYIYIIYVRGGIKALAGSGVSPERGGWEDTRNISPGLSTEMLLSSGAAGVASRRGGADARTIAHKQKTVRRHLSPPDSERVREQRTAVWGGRAGATRTPTARRLRRPVRKNRAAVRRRGRSDKTWHRIAGRDWSGAYEKRRSRRFSSLIVSPSRPRLSRLDFCCGERTNEPTTSPPEPWAVEPGYEIWEALPLAARSSIFNDEIQVRC